MGTPRLKNVKIEGFRSNKEMDPELKPINVCIGANGAGKSSLIAFFKMINEMMGGRLQQYLATTGRAAGNLYFGPRTTPQFEAEMKVEVDNGTDVYRTFARPDADNLREWLEDYSLGEIWEKNVIGGGPH